jgi:hypothetical protein
MASNRRSAALVVTILVGFAGPDAASAQTVAAEPVWQTLLTLGSVLLLFAGLIIEVVTTAARGELDPQMSPADAGVKGDPPSLER